MPVHSMVVGRIIPRGIGSPRARTTANGKSFARSAETPTAPLNCSQRRCGTYVARTQPSIKLNMWQRDTVREKPDLRVPRSYGVFRSDCLSFAFATCDTLPEPGVLTQSASASVALTEAYSATNSAPSYVVTSSSDPSEQSVFSGSNLYESIVDGRVAGIWVGHTIYRAIPA